MPTNFQLKQLKLKLDIVKKPETRVHELTDSNVSVSPRRAPRVRPGAYSSIATANSFVRTRAQIGKCNVYCLIVFLS